MNSGKTKRKPEWILLFPTNIGVEKKLRVLQQLFRVHKKNNYKSVQHLFQYVHSIICHSQNMKTNAPLPKNG